MKKYQYIVIEDDTNVWENIRLRMEEYPLWEPIDFSSEIDDAIDKIQKFQPELIFTDWSIKGGNAYRILSHIENTANYEPYVIFFTGYQSENPEIPERVFNDYQIVDKYIVKPIFENLTLHLHTYVKEAEERVSSQKYGQSYTIETADGIVWLNPVEIIAILQSEEDYRDKELILYGEKKYILRQTWEEIAKTLSSMEVKYFIAHRRAIVNTAYIRSAVRPFIYLENGMQVRVARDQWAKLSLL